MTAFEAYGLGQVEIKSPSGQLVKLTAEEEREIVKDAIREKILYGITRPVIMERAVIESGIGAIGNAIGFAAGGFLIGWLLGKSAQQRMR